MSLYTEELLDHFKNPQNFGIINNFTSRSKQVNPFCGDEIEVFVVVKKNKINNISFNGVGCAISIASGSLLTEYVKNKPLPFVKKFKTKDMINLLDLEISETRKKCALLPWSVLQDCI